MTEPSRRPTLRVLHVVLTVQSIVLVLLTVNRLSSLTLGYVAENEFLRWVDFNNMLLLPVASVLSWYVLKRHMETSDNDSGAEPDALRAPRPRAALWGSLFVLGVYLLGAGYGDHEVTNYLHGRFCVNVSPDGTPAMVGDGSPRAGYDDICRIIRYNDDDFSHWVFFAGFSLMNVALMLVQGDHPYRAARKGRDNALIAVNGLFLAAGVFANLAFEEIGLDLFVVAAVALAALVLLMRRGRQPLLLYFAIGYWLALVATSIAKLADL